MRAQDDAVLERVATCRFLVERYHRAFEEELPRLASLALRLAKEAGAAADAVNEALTELRDALLSHTAFAERTMYPHVGDDERLFAEQVAHHMDIRRSLARVQSVAASAAPDARTSVVAKALRHGLVNLDRNVEMFFALECTLRATADMPADAARFVH